MRGRPVKPRATRMAVIVASHLLGEIERVCTYLVAIEGGRLLRSAPLGDFMEQTGLPPASIDTCMQLGAAHPMGPIALLDYIGLDVSVAIGFNYGSGSAVTLLEAPIGTVFAQ